MAYPSSSSVSNPPSLGRHTTHPRLHIRNAADAQVVFEAVRLNILPMIHRRLGPTERDMLSSGDIFVWEETDQKGGLERWTDGRRWSQSRMREPFLYYEEKEPTTKEEKEAKAARRAYRHADPSAPHSSPSRRQDRPSKSDGLTKQTYSIFVNLGRNISRKWHLVAYFCGSDYTRLPVVEDYDYLRRIRVPNGVYVSSRGAQGTTEPDIQHDRNDGYRHNSGYKSPPTHRPNTPLLYTPFSQPMTPHAHTHTSQYSYPARTGGSSSHSSRPYTPVPGSSSGSSYMTTSIGAQTTGATRVPVPGHSRQPSDSSKPYVPLTSEDRRALGAFRVAL